MLPRRNLLSLCCALWLAACPLLRAEEPMTGEAMEEVVVTGEFPGPGMWKITRPGDPAGHVLWIVGDPPPLPKRMQWKSRDVEAVALESQEILLDSTLRMEPDEKIGVFRELTL